MSIKRLVPLNAVELSTDPTGARRGDIYYNTTAAELRVYDGTTWTPIAVVAATTANSSVAIGRYALSSLTTGSYNTGVGSASLNNTTTGQANVAIGVSTMYSNVTGGSNVAIGNNALGSNTGSYLNVAIGDAAGYSATGAGNIFIGYNAGYNETGANKLYIANSNTSTPLIGGDFNAKTLLLSANSVINSQSTSSPGLIVKGLASQTANLQEWQNSAGTVLTGITSAGQLYTTQRMTIGLNGISSIGQLVVSTGDVARVGVVVKAVTSQTADLQEWQNSAGTVLAKIDKDGNNYSNAFTTPGFEFYSAAENSGGFVFLKKETAAAANPGAGAAKIYFRDGTTAGTLKLVVKAGTAGAETTILDNIPQS